MSAWAPGLGAVFATLIERAQTEGGLRADLTPTEIAGLVKVMVCRPGARADDPLTVVLLAGLKP
ncbi:hypothetical protein [Embleya sp. AB8]|uniref:hypothetical protein n=1 Tax=Embleya sp. AB8 TaxID=3156304 RepID=UPI003C75058E